MNQTGLPEWLLGRENYEPRMDKDAFLDKSILSVLGVISRIRAQAAGPRVRGAHAPAKLALSLLVVVLLSLSQSQAFVLVVAVTLLCVLSLLPARQLARVLCNSVAATLFTAAVLLPALFMGNGRSMLMLTPKVFSTVTTLGLLSLGTRWNELTGAFKVFFVPDLFIFVLDIAIKYILLLGEFAVNMLLALKLRSVGRNDKKHTSLSGIAGTLFAHSREMAEELHTAMECRGFTGEYHRPGRFSMNLWDGAVVLTAAAAVGLFVYFR